MKKAIILILQIFLSVDFICQTAYNKRHIIKKEKIGKDYKFKDAQLYLKGGAQTSFPANIDRAAVRITEISGDIITFQFWDVYDYDGSKAKGARWTLNTTYSGKDFEYRLNSSDWKNGIKFKIPFRYRTITAVALPFRLKLDDMSLEADFLNFNIAHMWMFGRTTIYKKTFIEHRHSQWGFGPFAGLTSINNSDGDLKEFGVAYGLNLTFVTIQNITISTAVGYENGFSYAWQNRWFAGIGLGFKLVELYSPSYKENETD